MRPKLQKRSALKVAGRIIPEVQRNGVMRLKFQKQSPANSGRSELALAS